MTWVGFEVFVWSLLELHFALISASAPALKGFFETYVVAPLTSFSRTKDSSFGDTLATTKGAVFFDEARDWDREAAAGTGPRKGSESYLVDGPGEANKDIIVMTRFSVRHHQR